MATPTAIPTRVAPDLTPQLLDRIVAAVFDDDELATHGTPAEIGAYSLDSAVWAEQAAHIIANTLRLPTEADVKVRDAFDASEDWSTYDGVIVSRRPKAPVPGLDEHLEARLSVHLPVSEFPTSPTGEKDGEEFYREAIITLARVLASWWRSRTPNPLYTHASAGHSYRRRRFGVIQSEPRSANGSLWVTWGVGAWVSSSV